jgi:hypothetical protein
VLRAHGRAAAALVFVVAFFWVRRFTGFVATEALAFPLGAMGFGLLLRVVDSAEKEPRGAAVAFAAAIASVTLGLMARPGALLVVPALLLWTRWGFPSGSRLRALGAGLAGLFGALGATRLVASRLASGATFGDYPSIVYSLIHRGELNQALADHPELLAMPLTERGGAIVSVLLSDVKQSPSLLVVGPADAFVSFLFGPHGLFSFVWTNPDDHVLEDGALVRRLVAEHGTFAPLSHWVHELGLYSLLNAGVMGALGAVFALAVIVALVRLVRDVHRRRSGREPQDERSLLVLFVLLGILASSLFAPTWIGEGMQMDTAVFAFVPTALALGMRRSRSDPPERAPLRRIIALAVAAPAVLGLLIAGACAAPRTALRAGCDQGLLSARLNPSTRATVRSREQPTPNERSLATNLEFLKRHNAPLVASVRAAVHVGDVVDVVYDACAERTRIAVGTDHDLPAESTWRVLEASPQEDATVVVVRRPPIQ